ncbi:MAG: secF, partial [Alphaproteobacteria bacterium]|nr:secF [Alphaproteobacteria bacterium]
MRLLKLVPDNTNIGFVSLRGWAFGLTAMLTVVAIFFTVTKGLNLGVDFVGGLMIEAKFDRAAPVEDLRRTVEQLNVGEPRLQQFGGADTITLRLPLPPSKDPGANNVVINKVEAGVKAKYPTVQFNRADTVTGKVSDELIFKGIAAVVLSVFAIALFGWFRFEWQFGLSTFVAIGHDVLMTLGFFAVTGLEFDLNIVAAVLTIVGYSINDKIV